jgi:radical SAM protein with 4Fe4S-binding SPASM domain
MKSLLRNIRYFLILTSYLTFSRIGNLIQLLFSYTISFFGIQRNTTIQPFFLSVEIANFCNLHCPECPVGIRRISKSEKKLFDFELFKNIINELESKLLSVILYFQGEPFLNNQLIDFIQYAHKSNLFTSTSTNGQFITKDNAKILVMSGLDKIIISLDGTLQETYQKYRVGGSLEKTVDGIREIAYWKNKLKSATPWIEIQFLVLKTNEHQLKEMRQLAKNLKVDCLTFKTAQLYDFVNGNELMTSKTRYSRYKKNKEGAFSVKGRQPNRCWRLWSGAVVNANGEVLPCCFDKASEYSFGNVNEQSFSACWHSKKATDFREKILQNRKQFEICRNCTE